MINFDCGIYAITSPSGKQYIGQATSFARRWGDHRNYLRGGRHHCRSLQAAFNKYGEEALVFSKIAIVPPEDLNFREQEQIDARPRRNLYNTATNVIAPAKGFKHSKKALAEMSISSMGALNPMYGRDFSEEHRQRLSASNSGRLHTEETKKKIGDANRGRVMSIEARMRLSVARTGREISLEEFVRLKSDRRKDRAVVCIETGEEFKTVRAAAAWLRSIGLEKAAHNSIGMVCRGERMRAYGYTWRFSDPKFIARGLIKMEMAA